MRPLFFFLALLEGYTLGSSYNFVPEDAKQISNLNFPCRQQERGEEIRGTGYGSYWSSSFITGSNDHQYLVISHVLGMGSGNQGYYRGSVLDLTNLQYSSYVIDTSSSIFGNGTFNASTKDYGFGALSADEMSQLRTWTNYKNVVFDITFEGTSAALYNGGVGAFTFGSGTAHEWGMPGGRTTGFLTVNGSKIEIDTKRSFTWYDRQWGAAMGNWTWFQLNFNNGTAKASFWAIDTTTPYQRARFATVRTADGIHHFLPTMLTPNTEHTYLSNATDIEYPLQWDLKIGETDHLTIKSVRADQEIVGSAISDSAYEGFVMFLGTLLNKCKDLGWLRWSKLCSE